MELGRQQRGALGRNGAPGDGFANGGELAFAVQHRALVPACGFDAQLAQAVGGDLDRRQPSIHVAQLERGRLVGVSWRRCWRGGRSGRFCGLLDRLLCLGGGFGLLGFCGLVVGDS